MLASPGTQPSCCFHTKLSNVMARKATPDVGHPHIPCPKVSVMRFRGFRVQGIAGFNALGLGDSWGPDTADLLVNALRQEQRQAPRLSSKLGIYQPHEE